MKRQLLMMRHAKSDWDSGASGDFERPLSKRGLKDAPHMGRWMKDQGFIPDVVLSSPALRARQTVEMLMKALGIAVETICYVDRLYLADRDTLLEVLGESPAGAKRVLVVAHNPGMDALLEHLVGDSAPRNPQGKLMTTAALAVLETESPWRALAGSRCSLKRLVRPRELKEGKPGGSRR